MISDGGSKSVRREIDNSIIYQFVLVLATTILVTRNRTCEHAFQRKGQKDEDYVYSNSDGYRRAHGQRQNC